MASVPMMCIALARNNIRGMNAPKVLYPKAQQAMNTVAQVFSHLGRQMTIDVPERRSYHWVAIAKLFLNKHTIPPRGLRKVLSPLHSVHFGAISNLWYSTNGIPDMTSFHPWVLLIVAFPLRLDPGCMFPTTWINFTPLFFRCACCTASWAMLLRHLHQNFLRSWMWVRSGERTKFSSRVWNQMSDCWLMGG